MIHVSSLWAYQPANERMLPYAASKSGMHPLSRGFANVGAPYGVTRNVLAPGLILTEMVSKRLTPKMLQKELAGIPLGRGVTPEDVAETVVQMAANGFLTGEIVNLNGGAFMCP